MIITVEPWQQLRIALKNRGIAQSLFVKARLMKGWVRGDINLSTYDMEEWEAEVTYLA